MPDPIYLVVFTLGLLWLAITGLMLYLYFIKRGATPFHRACSKGDIAAVKAFLKADPSRLNRPDRFGIAPLQYAAGWNRVPVVEFLLDQGADVNRAKSGWTPLTLACAAGHQEVFDLLLAKGADPNATGPNPVYPIHAAVNQGRIQMTATLLQKGSNPNQLGEKKITPLHLAAFRGETSLIQLLLEHGADKQAVDASGNKPKDYARQERSPYALQLLD